MSAVRLGTSSLYRDASPLPCRARKMNEAAARAARRIDLTPGRERETRLMPSQLADGLGVKPCPAAPSPRAGQLS